MYPFTSAGNLDLTGSASSAQVRTLNGFIITAGAAATVVTFRAGSVTGPIILEIKVAAASTLAFSIPTARPLTFTGGIFIVPDANTQRGLVF